MTSRVFVSLVLVGALLALTPGDSMASDGALVLEGGTVHSLAGDPVETSVVIVDGVIQSLGGEVPAGATRLDISGLHVYPGFFDALSQMGLVEIGSVAATIDSAELGRFNAHLQATTAVHPDSEIIPVTRSNGISHALTAPRPGRDGVIAGQGAVIHLDGWTVEEMALDPSVAMVINWPAIQTRSFDFSTFTFRETPFKEAEKEAKEAQDELRDWLDAARHYAQADAAGAERHERNLKLEALARVLDGGLPVIVQVNAKRDIESAVAFAEEQGLEIILAGMRDGWEVADLLAEKDIPVILGRVASLPNQEDDPYDRPYRNAGALNAAGVKIAFGSGAGGGFGPGGPHSARTLPYEAGMAVAFGLPVEEALRALTLYPAEMLGLGDRLGTVEEGKIANLMVTNGNPLDFTSRVHHLIIGGREVSTDNMHRSLYERYRAR